MNKWWDYKILTDVADNAVIGREAEERLAAARSGGIGFLDARFTDGMHREELRTVPIIFVRTCYIPTTKCSLTD